MKTTLPLVVLMVSTMVVQVAAEPRKYFNMWVAKVDGGEETAKMVAKDLGYTYGGRAEPFENHYIYTKDDHPEESYTRADHHTKSLLDRDEVKWVEQQFHVNMALKGL